MRVRINNNQPNAAQRKALRQECVKEFDKLLADYDKQTALQNLYVLRFKCGFGMKRLKRHLAYMKEIQDFVRNRYEAIDDEVPSICEIRLRESGIDIDELFEI